MSSGISSLATSNLPWAKGDDPWQPVIKKIGEHVPSLLGRNAGLEQSFCWRVIVREFARSPMRRLLVGAELAVINPGPASLTYARAVVAESSLLAEGSERRLRDYVSFTRAGFHPVDKLSCDWCAICNGLLAWTGDVLDDALRSSRTPIAQWRFDGNHRYRRALEGLRWFPLSAVQRNYDRARVAAQVEDIRERARRRLAPAELEAFMDAARHFVVVRHNAASLEKRYCPFRHLRALAYAPEHWLYDWRAPESVEIAARVLAAQGEVDCHGCAAALASSPLVPVEDTPSIMSEYFELLCRTSTGADRAAAAHPAANASGVWAS